METQINQLLYRTKYGQLHAEKDNDEDGMPCMKLSTVYNIEGSYVKFSVTFSFDNDEALQKGFDQVSDSPNKFHKALHDLLKEN